MGKGLSGTALGFSIAGLVLFWLPIVGFFLWLTGGILAIIAFIKCKSSEQGRGLAIASLVITIISFLVFAASVAYISMGMFNTETFLPDKCIMQAPFSCVEYKVAQDEIVLGIEQHSGGPLYNVEVLFDSEQCGSEKTLLTAEEIPANSRLGGSLLSVNCPGLEVGERFTGNLKISYQRSASGQSISAPGMLQAKVE